MATSDSTTPFKRCTKCGNEYSDIAGNFVKDKSKPDGLSSWCKTCRRVSKSTRNQDLAAEVKAKRLNDPEFSLIFHQATNGYKRCSKCGNEKLAIHENFEYHDQKPDGLRPECRDCTNTQRRDYRNRNIEKFRAYGRKQYVIHHARLKEYRDKNRDKVRDYNKIYAAVNSEKAVIRMREWATNNPEKYRLLKRVAAHRRRLRVEMADGYFTSVDIEALYSEQCGLCAYCGIRLYEDFEIDHVLPISKGGSNSVDNLLLACPTCNRKKNARTLEEWMEVRGW